MREPDESLLEFERLLRETYRMVFQIAHAALANAADAEEVAQDVFLHAYRKLPSLRDPSKFRWWVSRMSWRMAMNRLRSQSRAARRDGAWLAGQPAAADPEACAARRELSGMLDRHIAALPEKLRSVLLLRAIEGLDVPEVAGILGIPEGTVRSRLFLARRHLMKALSL
jgi:RNA polymerase sigma-70 factor (ECF subfamily)